MTRFCFSSNDILFGTSTWDEFEDGQYLPRFAAWHIPDGELLSEWGVYHNDPRSASRLSLDESETLLRCQFESPSWLGWFGAGVPTEVVYNISGLATSWSPERLRLTLETTALTLDL